MSGAKQCSLRDGFFPEDRMSGRTLGCHHWHLGGRGDACCRYSRMHRTASPRPSITKDYPSLDILDAKEACTQESERTVSSGTFSSACPAAGSAVAGGLEAEVSPFAHPESLPAPPPAALPVHRWRQGRGKVLSSHSHAQTT